MTNATAYDSTTGRVLQSATFSAKQGWTPPTGDHVAILEGERLDPVTEYVFEGERTPRPTLEPDKTEIVADGIDAAAIAGLPDPCTVRVTDPDGLVTAHEATGGTFELAADLPGDYRVKIGDLEAFPAQALDVTITAVSP